MNHATDVGYHLRVKVELLEILYQIPLYYQLSESYVTLAKN